VPSWHRAAQLSRLSRIMDLWTPEYVSTADIFTTPTSPYSWFSYIGVYNSIPEYAFSTSMSIVMTMSFHVMPFEKRFLKKWFSPQISAKPPSPQETEHRKKEEERRKRKKDPRVSSNKRGSNQYFERRNILQLQRFFFMWFYFLPLHHTISKTLSKIIEKVFLALFGSSFSLATHMTWVVPFLFTHEFHILEGRMKRNICWAEVRDHKKSNRVPNVEEP
jgi:hypothetical protein